MNHLPNKRRILWRKSREKIPYRKTFLLKNPWSISKEIVLHCKFQSDFANLERNSLSSTNNSAKTVVSSNITIKVISKSVEISKAPMHEKYTLKLSQKSNSSILWRSKKKNKPYTLQKYSDTKDYSKKSSKPISKLKEKS